MDISKILSTRARRAALAVGVLAFVAAAAMGAEPETETADHAIEQAETPENPTQSGGFSHPAPAYHTSRGLTVIGGGGVRLQSVAFQIAELGLDQRVLETAPNTPVHALMGAYWRRMGLSVRLSIPGTAGNEEERGTTTFRHVQAQLTGHAYQMELFYKQHTGMYIANADRFDPPIDPITLSDMRVENFGYNMFLATDRALSLAAAYQFAARQVRSTWSLVLMNSAYRVQLTVPGGPARNVQPDPDAPDNRRLETWQQDTYIRATGFVAGGGVAGNMTSGRWYVSPLLTVGAGLQYVSYALGSSADERFALAPHVSGRMSVGYNGPTWFMAIVGAFDARAIETGVTASAHISSRAELVFGRRFAPAW